MAKLSLFVTISEDQNGDISDSISSQSKPDKSDIFFKPDSGNQTKVRVNWPKPRLRNVILSQFPFHPDTDSTSVSSVWDKDSRRSVLKSHIESDHDEQGPVKSDVTAKTVQASVLLNSVDPLQVSPTHRPSSNSNFTSGTFNYPSSPPVNPLQVLLHPVNSVGYNFTNETEGLDSFPVISLLVSSQITTLNDFNTATTTTLTLTIFQQWSRPGPRLIWQIAWYVRHVYA